MTPLLDENKIIFVDWGLFLHKSIFAWEAMRKIRDGEIAEHGYSKKYVPEPTYLALAMVLKSLRLVGIQQKDLVIVAIDGRGNWRKDVDPQYKANRKAVKQLDDIDWLYWYKEFDLMVEALKTSTPFNFIRIDKLEADDIIAVGVKYFKDKECIVISIDSDFDQLTAYKNVKLFNPNKEEFKLVKNPYDSLNEKVKKEKTDNLISPIITEADLKRRLMIVSLLDLPEFVSTKALDELKKVGYNSYNLEDLPFPKLKDRFSDIYNSKQALTLEKTLKKKLKISKKKKEEKNGRKRKNLPNSSQITEW